MTTTCLVRGPTVSYLRGTTLRSDMTFEDPNPPTLTAVPPTDADNPWVDPDTVRLSIRRPVSSPQVETLEYGVDAQIVKDSVGHYHAIVVGDEDGEWVLYWEGIGTWPAVDEVKFNIKPGGFFA